MEELQKTVSELGEKVAALKRDGKDPGVVLEEFLKQKTELSNVVKPIYEKFMEEEFWTILKSGDKEAIETAEEKKKKLAGMLVEEKGVKKKREKNEKAKRKEVLEGGNDQKKQEKKKDGPSKKELNKLKKKENRQKAKEEKKPVAEESKPKAAAPAAAAAAPAPVPGKPETVPNTTSIDLSFPLVSIMVASFCNSKKKVTKDTKSLTTDDGVELFGDLTMARYLARTQNGQPLYGENLSKDAITGSCIVEQWIEYAYIHIHHLCSDSILKHLDNHLLYRTYIGGCELSLADFVIWGAIVRLDHVIDGKKYRSLDRWSNMVKSLPGFGLGSGIYKRHLSNKSTGSNEKVTIGGATKKKIKVNMPPLKGAIEGQVVTRFPPEPSGHLHIGHVKAIMLNKYYAERYNGKMLVRFDDTNPSKEKLEYEEGILEDLKSLDITPFSVSHTSDHFETILKYALQLIKQGDAYMDDTSQEQMKEERWNGIKSARHDLPVEENFFRFFVMTFGLDKCVEKAKIYKVKIDPKRVAEEKKVVDALKKEEKSPVGWVLRAKMDYANKNKTLRDPVLFRSNPEPHARTKDKYKAYPTYDLACPIVDSIEGVTHAMRDIQYRERTPQYQWFFPKLGLRPVEIQDFSRMNFLYTLMSKRKLKWFVENGRVKSWDDPRFPTIKGILRRGMQVDALFEFMVGQGSSKSLIDMEYDKFWAINKKVIDPVAPRIMGVSAENNIAINIQTMDGKPFPESVKMVRLVPKDETKGLKPLFLGPTVFVEMEDILAADLGEIKPNEQILLLNWGVVIINTVEKDPNGVITKIVGKYDPNGDVKVPKRKMHWVSDSPHNIKVTMHEFDYLITKKKLVDENTGEELDFKDHINENSIATTTLICEPSMRHCPQNSFLQLLRRGYFRVDKAYIDNKRNVDLFQIPDGKTKSMSTLSTKLAHR